MSYAPANITHVCIHTLLESFLYVYKEHSEFWPEILYHPCCAFFTAPTPTYFQFFIVYICILHYSIHSLYLEPMASSAVSGLAMKLTSKITGPSLLQVTIYVGNSVYSFWSKIWHWSTSEVLQAERPCRRHRVVPCGAVVTVLSLAMLSWNWTILLFAS